MNQSNTQLSGVVSMVKASIAFSLMALCVKIVSRGLPSLEVVFFRSLIGTVMLVAIIKAQKVSLIGGKYKHLMLLRGITGFAALSLHFYTIANMPLGTAVMLNYTAPIFSSIFAVIFLKERPGQVLWLLTLISFAGVFLLTGAKLHHWDLMVFLGLLSAVFVGVVYVSIRAIRGNESPLTIIFYFTAVSTVGSLAFLPFGFEWPDLMEWLLLFGVGIGSFYGQLWMTVALRQAPASLVSPFSYLMPLLSFIYGYFFFGDSMTVSALAGAGLIIFSGVLISWFGTRKIDSEIY